MEHVLVTGATGQLGYDTCKLLRLRGVPCVGIGMADCDITDIAAVKELFVRERPNVVIHCAAYTAVDKAEDEPEKCWAVNVVGTWNIAEECKAAEAKMVYVSTDYVYAGLGERAWEVTDGTAPSNVYGRTKLAGELAVRALLRKYFIVRTSWVFGRNGSNFVKTMLRIAETRDRIGVVADQIGSPTYTADLAVLLCDMIQTEQYGTYHATNEGFCSWAGFAEEIFRIAGKSIKVDRLTTAEYPVKAIRPLNSRMSKDSLDAAGWKRLPRWESGLSRFLEELHLDKKDNQRG